MKARIKYIIQGLCVGVLLGSSIGLVCGIADKQAKSGLYNKRSIVGLMCIVEEQEQVEINNYTLLKNKGILILHREDGYFYVFTAKRIAPFRYEWEMNKYE